MRLDEAKVILEENGYELLEEGKLGRALAAGALALGSLFGFSNASVPKSINDLQTDSTYTQIELSEVPSKLKTNDFYTADKIYYDTKDDYYYAINGNKMVISAEEKFNTEINFDKNGIRKSATFVDNDKYGEYLNKLIFDKEGKLEKEITYYDEDGEYIRTIKNAKTKTGVEYYDTGEIKCEFKIDKDGYKNGVLKMYYKNGKYAGARTYKHGEFVGITKCVDGRRGGEALNCQIPIEN